MMSRKKSCALIPLSTLLRAPFYPNMSVLRAPFYPNMSVLRAPFYPNMNSPDIPSTALYGPFVGRDLGLIVSIRTEK